MLLLEIPDWGHILTYNKVIKERSWTTPCNFHEAETEPITSRVFLLRRLLGYQCHQVFLLTSTRLFLIFHKYRLYPCQCSFKPCKCRSVFPLHYWLDLVTVNISWNATCSLTLDHGSTWMQKLQELRWQLRARWWRQASTWSWYFGAFFGSHPGPSHTWKKMIFLINWEPWKISTVNPPKDLVRMQAAHFGKFKLYCISMR